MTPDVSVVAVAWNCRDSLVSALDVVPAACAPVASEIIVIDNGSTDGTVEQLAGYSDVRLVALGTNTGFTHAANIGAGAAAGRHLLFLNPDVLAPPGSIAALVDVLDNHPEAWGATPWFRNLDGTPQHFWKRLPGAPSLFLCYNRWGRALDRMIGGTAGRRRDYADLDDPPGLVVIDGVGAACLLVRRDEFLDAGGFDERYFNFFQDADFQRRMRGRGRDLLGVGSVEVTHEVGVTLRQLPADEVQGQFLYAFRQFLSGEPWYRRWIGTASVHLDVAGRPELKRRVLRPLRPPV